MNTSTETLHLGTWLASAIGLLLSLSATAADALSVNVELSGIRSNSGHLRASLYDQAETFRKEGRALQRLSLPAKPGSARFAFADLPPGRYAVMVYHDENDDQTLNLRFGMFPTEGYGLSNNPKVMGPPRFADSAFELKSGSDTNIAIELTY